MKIGATLKSQVEENFEKLPVECLDYVKNCLFASFGEKENEIRSTVSNLMTLLISKGGFQKWPELLSFMINNLEQMKEERVVLSTI